MLTENNSKEKLNKVSKNQYSKLAKRQSFIRNERQYRRLRAVKMLRFINKLQSIKVKGRKSQKEAKQYNFITYEQFLKQSLDSFK